MASAIDALMFCLDDLSEKSAEIPGFLERRPDESMGFQRPKGRLQNRPEVLLHRRRLCPPQDRPIAVKCKHNCA